MTITGISVAGYDSSFILHTSSFKGFPSRRLTKEMATMRLARRSFVTFASLLFPLSVIGAARPQDSPPKGVSELGWISGKWVLESRGSRQEEIWSAPDGGSMVGIMRVTRD